MFVPPTFSVQVHDRHDTEFQWETTLKTSNNTQINSFTLASIFTFKQGSGRPGSGSLKLPLSPKLSPFHSLNDLQVPTPWEGEPNAEECNSQNYPISISILH